MDFKYYVLRGHEAEVCDDVLEWSAFFDSKERQVGLTENEYYSLSTVFLGFNHQHFNGPPILFETMVFIRDPYMEIVPLDQSLDGYCCRYSSWDDAAAGHEAMVKRLGRQIDLAKAAALKKLVSQPLSDDAGADLHLVNKDSE